MSIFARRRARIASTPVRARVRATIPTSLPGQGPAASRRRVTPTVQLTRLTPPKIGAVREAPDQGVAVRLPARTAAAPGLASAPAGADAAAIVELFRLKAADGERVVAQPIPASFPARTLLIYNPLTAPVFIKFGAGTPTALNHDLAAPGSSIMSWPIDRNVGRVAAAVDYPGVVPLTDVAEVVVRVSSEQLAPFVGPLN